MAKFNRVMALAVVWRFLYVKNNFLNIYFCFENWELQWVIKCFIKNDVYYSSSDFENVRVHYRTTIHIDRQSGFGRRVVHTVAGLQLDIWLLVPFVGVGLSVWTGAYRTLSGEGICRRLLSVSCDLAPSAVSDMCK